MALQKKKITFRKKKMGIGSLECGNLLWKQWKMVIVSLSDEVYINYTLFTFSTMLDFRIFFLLSIIDMFIYLFLVVLNLVCCVCTGLSLVVLSSSYSVVEMCGLASACCRANGSQIIGIRNSEKKSGEPRAWNLWVCKEKINNPGQKEKTISLSAQGLSYVVPGYLIKTKAWFQGISATASSLSCVCAELMCNFKKAWAYILWKVKLSLMRVCEKKEEAIFWYIVQNWNISAIVF